MHNFIQFRKHLQSLKTIEGKLYEELRPQGTHYLYTSLAFHLKKETKFTKQKKWEKITKVLYPNHMHIFIPCWKHLQCFKKIGGKL